MDTEINGGERKMKLYALLEPRDDLDKAILKIKKGGWKLAKKGRKYLEFEKKTSLGTIKVRVKKERYEKFNIDSIDWKLTITEVEPFMSSTYIFFIGKKEECLEKLEELKKEHDVEIEEWTP